MLARVIHRVIYRAAYALNMYYFLYGTAAHAYRLAQLDGRTEVRMYSPKLWGEWVGD